MEELPSFARMLQLVLAGICLFLVVFGIVMILFSNVFFNEPRVMADESEPAAPPFNVSRSFNFHNQSQSVSILVNGSVYAASKKAYRSIFLVGDPKSLASRYYLPMINDPTQDRIYKDLLIQFRNIRYEQNLSDDEYLELMTAYVQTIPYKAGNTPPKYPAELLVENMGDCDDKAILLSGLLAREGYSVVLLKFGPENHMAMGVGSDAFPYRETGYTYLEAMTPAYVGIPSFTLMTKKPLTSEPVIIPVSSGTRIYRAGNETSSINNKIKETEQKTRELTARLDAFPASEKNSPEYIAVLGERDRDARIHEYLITHPLDRPGVYAYLKREMAGETV